MTTETDFQDALDACPEDFTCRLVFADWLQDRDDPRAEGYRALGVTKLFPAVHHENSTWGGNDHPHTNNRDWMKINRHVLLPKDWFHAMPFRDEDFAVETLEIWKYFPTRREAEDAAAIAFSKLSPERRAELLAGKS